MVGCPKGCRKSEEAARSGLSMMLPPTSAVASAMELQAIHGRALPVKEGAVLFRRALVADVGPFHMWRLRLLSFIGASGVCG